MTVYVALCSHVCSFLARSSSFMSHIPFPLVLCVSCANFLCRCVVCVLQPKHVRSYTAGMFPNGGRGASSHRQQQQQRQHRVMDLSAPEFASRTVGGTPSEAEAMWSTLQHNNVDEGGGEVSV